MEVIAFVGPSGTGKSHHAIGVAFDNKCDGIIDDGLLIKGTKILAGTSAKNEQNRIQAVKRAIFTDSEHAAEVRKALATSGIKRLLIIATSDNMIGKITKKLELDPPVKTVYIHQVASKAEIKSFKTLAVSSMIQTLDASSVNPKDATLNAMLDLTDCNYSSIEYGFELTPEGGKAKTLTANNLKDKAFSYRDKTLSRNTGYSYVAYVKLDGILYKAEPKTFTTTSIQASVSAAASDIQYYSATISGF